MGCQLSNRSGQEFLYFKNLISLKKINLYLFLYVNLVFLVLVVTSIIKIPMLFALVGYCMLNLIAVVRYMFHKKWYKEYETKGLMNHTSELSVFQRNQFKRSIGFFTVFFVVLNILLNLVNDSNSIKAVVEVAYLSFISASIFFATPKCFEKK